MSRASELAVLQATLVGCALQRHWPDLQIQFVTRSSHGDRDVRAALWTQVDKGLFTSDLSQALLADEADVVVHSWKDLPLEPLAGAAVAATLERADPRDVLLFRRDVVERAPAALTLLSSSPRRTWQIGASMSPLMPWPVERWQAVPVRGNIPTRLKKLAGGEGDALIVAKAALDRLLSRDAAPDTRAAVRELVDGFRWMVLPIRDFPTAAAQGALAIEVADRRSDVRDRLAPINHAPTWRAVTRERQILASFGGGCHDPIGATVLPYDFGDVLSVRADVAGAPQARWTIENAVAPPPPRTDAAHMWPAPNERDRVARRPFTIAAPASDAGWFVARAEALPAEWTVAPDRLVWAAGTRTWRRLAARGIWVHGCADGLGDAAAPAIDTLVGRPLAWTRLTHTGAASDDPSALGTYVVDAEMPADLASRTHFFWSSGQLLRAALDRFPAIREGWHASGPGRTARAVRAALGSDARTSIWLEYEQWHQAVTS